MGQGSISRLRKQREVYNEKHPNRIPVTEILYVCRFPELTEEIMWKVMRELEGKK